MGGGVLADIARDLGAIIRRSISVDWVARDDVRAKLRTIIKRLLAKYDYPPDAEAIELVIRQMETFAEDWTPGGPSHRERTPSHCLRVISKTACTGLRSPPKQVIAAQVLSWMLCVSRRVRLSHE
jgi:hypothetical protein